MASPPPGQIYHAAFPDFGGPEDRVSAERLAAFEALAGRPVAWAYFSNNWDDGIRFPTAAVQTISAASRVPFIRMMARSDFDEGGPGERYTMQSIVAGDWDADLRARPASRPTWAASTSAAWHAPRNLRVTSAHSNSSRRPLLPPMVEAEAALPRATPRRQTPRSRVGRRRRRSRSRRRSASARREGGSTFECKLDDGAFEGCTSPEDVKVKKGNHTFAVRAKDAAGNVDPAPATQDWKVKKKRKK